MAEVRLEIYVANACRVCARSAEIANEVLAMFHDVAVDVIDLGGPGGQHRDLVVAAPTYVLNGRLFSLGNPTGVDLSAAIARLQRGDQS